MKRTLAILALVSALEKSRTLVHVNLSETYFQDAGALALAAALARCVQMEYLSLVVQHAQDRRGTEYGVVSREANAAVKRALGRCKRYWPMWHRRTSRRNRRISK